MNSIQPFTIYNASAGSGKTFSLVKIYLKQLLSSSQKGYFKYLLAITFTNKAVAEMKERIVYTLVDFSKDLVPEKSKGMLDFLVEETNLTSEEIQKRSGKILKHLLHHYAQFSVETIDHFNHRLIRTFARDLGLATNFDVSLDAKQLVAQAVDQLINKAGEDKTITKILLEYALQKTDEDKSWDIARDLNQTASLLLNENDAKHLEKLKTKSLQEFIDLRKEIRDTEKSLRDKVVGRSTEMISIFQNNQLTVDHFSRGSVFNFFLKISEENLKITFDAAWQNSLESKPLYPGRVKGPEAELIDSLVPQIVDAFGFVKSNISTIALYQNILKNIVPLATLNLINQELQIIKEEENILPINEFNALIHSKIKDEPAPFIYERLGDRYRHYFIDEFQDTSLLQWNNLIPLIDNSLSQEYEDTNAGSLVLVGDAKQSIYRWRGGLPEQFIDLCNSLNPFSISKEDKRLVQLDTNYRSCKEIVNFNNSFFTYLSQHFGDEVHTQLYEIGNAQKTNSKGGGYVHLEFVEFDKKEEGHGVYGEKVLSAIQNTLALGFSKRDITILTRGKKDGIAISQFLVEHEIPVISEETLLLKHSSQVSFIIAMLQLSIHPENEEVKIAVLDFVYHHLGISQSGQEEHDFYQEHRKKSLLSLSDLFLQLKTGFEFEQLKSLSLFESCEYIIYKWKLFEQANSFLFSFMDLVFNFSQRPETGKVAFLEYWETEKEGASIASNKGTDAISVMTIHKSKGLEFPVVIMPYADIDIYKEIEATAWYPYENDNFKELLINYSKSVENYGEDGARLVQERRNTLELDNLNLLYVALTRAEQHLYVFGKNETIKGSPTTFNKFLKGFLQSAQRWNDESLIYTFGEATSFLANSSEVKLKTSPVEYTVSLPDEHNISMVTSNAFKTEENIEAVYFGNLLHDTMAKIKTHLDLEEVISELSIQLADENEIFTKVEKTVRQIVNHPELNSLFNISDEIYNERDIITPTSVIRPDRFNIQEGNKATLLDYKTGVPNIDHLEQIKMYGAALEEMDYSITEMILVYCNDNGILINKS